MHENGSGQCGVSTIIIILCVASANMFYKNRGIGIPDSIILCFTQYNPLPCKACMAVKFKISKPPEHFHTVKILHACILQLDMSGKLKYGCAK